jgi:hypothetical protein
MHTSYYNQYTEETITTFLGLQTDSHLIWKSNTDFNPPQLSTACFTLKLLSSLAR